MNNLQRTTLRQYYTDAQVTAWFGARSDRELGLLIDALATMTPGERIAFGRQCAAVRRMQRARKPLQQHSEFGRMLVEMSHEVKHDK